MKETNNKFQSVSQGSGSIHAVSDFVVLLCGSLQSLFDGIPGLLVTFKD